jgi:CheY-like chemotaxis protein
MADRPQVLIVDDQVGDLLWLLDLIKSRGYRVRLATNEAEASERLLAVKEQSEAYVAAVIDVMVAVKDLMELMALDEQFFEDSRNTGIRLCRYARKELGISPEQLPIACLTVRDDNEVKEAMRELAIPLYNRAPQSPSESIRGFVEQYLPLITT